MSLREDLKNYIPKYLWQTLNHPEGYIISNEEFNGMWNMIQQQGDHNTNTIKNLLQLLYDTLLNDVDGASHLKVALPGVNAENVKQVLQLLDQRVQANSSKYDEALSNSGHAVLTSEAANANSEYAVQVSDEAKGQASHALLVSGEALVKANEIYNLHVDSAIKVFYEVFTILSADNGDGTFTYRDSSGDEHIGQVEAGYQEFKLTQGDYTIKENRISAYINDTLHRSEASGGLVEVDSNTVKIASELAGAEITFKYFSIIGSMGSSVVIGTIDPPNPYFGKLFIDLR